MHDVQNTKCTLGTIIICITIFFFSKIKEFYHCKISCSNVEGLSNSPKDCITGTEPRHYRHRSKYCTSILTTNRNWNGYTGFNQEEQTWWGWRRDTTVGWCILEVLHGIATASVPGETSGVVLFDVLLQFTEHSIPMLYPFYMKLVLFSG